jgi:hypothetical protein
MLSRICLAGSLAVVLAIAAGCGNNAKPSATSAGAAVVPRATPPAAASSRAVMRPPGERPAELR